MFAAIDNPEALAKYYKLVLSIVRIIVSVIISRGQQNEQTIEQAKAFLSETRSLILAVFKKRARIDTGGGNLDADVDELARSFVILMTLTDFLDVS